MNLAWWLEHSTSERGDKAAAIDSDGTTMSYAELSDLAARTATVLRDEYGVNEGDVVASLHGDSGSHMAVMYATLRLGAVFTALNPRLQPDRLGRDLDTCGATVVVAQAEHRELADRLAADRSHCAVWQLGDAAAAGGLRDQVADACALAEIVPRANDDVAAINFTAGSTGNAKGVVFTHGTLGTSAQLAVFTSQITSKSVNLSLIGLHHSGGLHDAIKFVMAGATIILAGGWDVTRVVGLLRAYRPDWIFFIVPTMVRDLMRHPAWAELDLTGVRTYVAGEPVPNDVATALEAKGVGYANAYGMTETMPFRITGPRQVGSAAPLGSSGRPNREFCTVVLKDMTTGEVVNGAGVQGEICVKGDIVSPGYYGDAARTADLFDGEGYLHTRDVAYRDDEGWYFLCGRTDDLINCGGEKLSLVEVDEALMSSGLVIDVACTGVAHERFGEAPAAFVVKRSDDEDAVVANLLDAHMIREIERWKRPRLYIFVEAIPRVAAKGTKARHQLRSELAATVLPNSEQVLVRDGREKPGVV